MNKGKLSIVIPVYNEKNTIKKIIGLVEGVNIPLDKEIIIVNDGSDDGTGKILNEYQDKHKIIHLEKNA
jgi:glycosyltransferase involved in cell wall biosynthesis